MFDVAKGVPQYLKNKRFCVFDLETTGLDTSTCKIIEVAGVLIEDGHLTQVFNSFVNPHEPITPRITELTSITDSDVANAPEIEDVLADFYKFSENTVFVGHNVSFDIGFLNASGKELGIYFDNLREDTLDIARHTLKGLKNFKLGTVLKHLGLVNEHAHRAIHDTIATAKAFMLMAEKL
jgi:DNA polymerase-3 subunit alpha (Gram-positive type)